MKLQDNTFFLSELRDVLDDLCKRLQDDYAGDKDFEQYDDDRCAVYDAIELLDELLGKTNHDRDQELIHKALVEYEENHYSTEDCYWQRRINRLISQTE